MTRPAATSISSTRRPLTTAQVAEVVAAGRVGGLDAVGTCSAGSWTATRDELFRRRDAGRAGSMQFTYRNPARSTEPTRILRNAASLFVATRSYAQSVPAAPDVSVVSDVSDVSDVAARIARYSTSDHYGRLETGLRCMATVLREWGYRAVVVSDTNGLVDREAAWRAGLGWYGKNSLLLAPGAGSWFVIGSVVTDARVATIPRPVADGCGGCTRCLQACPTAAIVSPGTVDARRCLSWLLQAPGPFPLEFRRALGNRIYGCDDCQEVCPPNRTLELRTRHEGVAALPVEHEPGTWIGACELLDCEDGELLERCARWYIHGRDPAIVRRNLLIVLANSLRDDGLDSARVGTPVNTPVNTPAKRRALALFDRYIDHPDPVLAETARWASAEVSGRLASGVGANEDGPR